MPVTLTCEECQNAFTKPPSQSSARWCSWDCRVASGAHREFNSKPRNRNCATCGNTIMSKPSRGNRFCSLACYHRAPSPRRNRIVRTCRNCGKRFEKRPSEIEIGRGKHCSKSCAALARPIRGGSKIADAAIEEWAKTSTTEHVTELRIGRWSIDLAIPEDKHAIELDGIYWHSLPEMVAKDARKDAYLEAEGWTVTRIVFDGSDTPETIAQRITAVAA